MATVIGIDCSLNRSNIGVGDCIANPGQKVGHIKVPLGWSAPVTELFDKAYFNNLVQQGIAQFFSNAFGVTTETADPTMETSSLQISAVTTRPLPMVTSIFKKGYEWHAKAFLNSDFQQSAVIEIFQDGSLRLVLSKDGLTVSGFSVSMYEVLGLQDATADARQQTRIMYQMSDLLQYNSQGIFLTNLNFNPNTEINNIADVRLVGRASVTNQMIYVKPTLDSNMNEGLASLSKPNFRLEVDGVVDVISSPTVTRDPATKEYAIEPTATLTLTSDIQVFLTDATATPPVDVAKVGVANPKYYDGETVVFQPVA